MANLDINISEIEFLPKPTIHNFIDLEGQTFHYLTVLGIVEYIPQGRINVWLCRCKCGNYTKVRAQLLRTKHTKSCGCWSSEVTTTRNTTHGLSHLPEYEVWEGMRRRCNNPSRPEYPAYGGRGIVVCERWNSFEKFFADMGERPSSEHSIERRNNDGNYCAENCIWALPIVQANNKRTSHFLTCNGKTQTIAQWCRELGISHARTMARLKRGWNIEKVLYEPKHINRYA